MRSTKRRCGLDEITKPADRPRDELIPTGCEWLPKAFSREVAQLGPEARERARERVRRALGDGVIKAMGRTLWGHEWELPRRAWNKENLERDVYPRFKDGWIRIREEPTRGEYFEGWIYVPEGSLQKLLSPTEDSSPALGRPTLTPTILEAIYRLVAECEIDIRASPMQLIGPIRRKAQELLGRQPDDQQNGLGEQVIRNAINAYLRDHPVQKL